MQEKFSIFSKKFSAGEKSAGNRLQRRADPLRKRKKCAILYGEVIYVKGGAPPVKKYRLPALLLAAATLLSAAGCSPFSLSPEGLLEPPRLTKQQEEIREVLADSLGTQDFRFFTPRAGKNRTSVLFADLYGSSDAEAIVLYQLTSSEETRVNILTRDADAAWTELCDFAPAAGSAVERIDTAAVEPTGYQQLFLGTALYTGRESALSAWALDTGKPENIFSASYAEMVVGDLNGDETDELALLNTLSEGGTSFALYDHSGDENGIALCAEELLDVQFLSFSLVSVGTLDTGSRAVFIDGRVGTDTYATEVVAIRSGVPEKLFGVDCPTRTLSLTCRDIDGDGNPEIPLQDVLPGYSDVATNDRVMRIDWGKLGVAGLTSRTVSAVNTKWQYLFLIPERLAGTVTVLSDEEDDAWTLCLWDAEKQSTSRKILTVRCHALSQWEETASFHPEETVFLKKDNVCFTAVFYQENVISLTELKDLIVLL